MSTPNLSQRLRACVVAGALVAAAACSPAESDPQPIAGAGAAEAAAETTVGEPTDTTVEVDDGYPDQPEGVPFPGADWPEAEPDADVDVAALDAAAEVAFVGPEVEAQRVASVVVVQGGQIVYERYHPANGPDDVFDSWSMAKSFTSALIGLLVDDGRLELDEHPARAEWPEGDPRGAITLRHLLQMSSGLQWDEGPDYVPWATSPDIDSFVASRPLEFTPGEQYEYSTGTTSLLAGIAADELGGCAPMEEYLQDRLLDPIGITTELLLRGAGDCWFGGFGINMTTRDFARFGLLYLRGGNWDGEQIISTAWVDETRVPATTNEMYGLQFWLDPEGRFFGARGAMGQRIVIVPDHDLVVAVNNFNGDDCSLIASVLTEFTDGAITDC